MAIKSWMEATISGSFSLQIWYFVKSALKKENLMFQVEFGKIAGIERIELCFVNVPK
jgi:hypothetical protein